MPFRVTGKDGSHSANYGSHNACSPAGPSDPAAALARARAALAKDDLPAYFATMTEDAANGLVGGLVFAASFATMGDKEAAKGLEELDEPLREEVSAEWPSLQFERP